MGREILKEVFGYDSFRDEQEAIVDSVVGGADAIVLAPTGSGKSVCYQVPAIVRQRAGHGVTVVVSPLIALMHDQVAMLQELGVAAAYLNSSLSPEEFAGVRQEMMDGELTLLYAAPERVTNPNFLADLTRLNEAGKLSLFAIDEAHCVSQWGHDFRPEYVALKVLHENFPGVPRIALTATADELTRAEIAKHLDLGTATMYVSSFDRPNISYEIVEKKNARAQLLSFIRDKHQGHAGIVYCLSRKKVEQTAAFLCENGVEALPYHAGLSAATRRLHQDRFLREDGLVMTATIAFGMGIDKPDVRFVAHLDMPKNIEGYYQETGRAGRDGEPAEAWMAYGLQDVVLQRRMLEGSLAEEGYKQVLRRKLDALLGLCESTHCRRTQLLAYFGEAKDACGNCDNCVTPPQTWDAGEPARKLLSCIYRCEQNFGSAHIFDVLIGKQTDKVERFGHAGLAVYGQGVDLDEQQWRGVLRQLIARGLVGVDHDHYNVLRLTGGWREFVKSKESLPLRVATKSARVRTRTRKAPVAREQALAEIGATGEELFERLRAWRQVQANERGVPVYIIFNDSTLLELAGTRPTSLVQLQDVKGIGMSKLERYGTELLAIVAASPTVDTTS